MRGAQKTTLLGRAYVVSPLPSGKAITIGTKIMKAVGPTIAKLASIDELLSATGASLEGLLDSIGENDLEVISRAFAEQTQAEIEPGTGNLVALAGGTFDVLFAGAIDEWFEWFKFCLGLNYGPLFAGVTAKLVAARAEKAAAKASG
jgi:hypothetical protein